MAFWPDSNERTWLAFTLSTSKPPTATETANPAPGGSWLGLRYVAAATLFSAGMIVAGQASTFLGVLLILLGHVPLWVKRQRLAPNPPDRPDGKAFNPLKSKVELVWVPVGPEGFARIRDLEDKGRRWDHSYLDITNARGLVTLLLLVVAMLFGAVWVRVALGTPMGSLLAVTAALLLPIWLNGMRFTWQPSDLLRRVQALSMVAPTIQALAPDVYDPVEMIGTMQGRKGQIPVDARVMLRPRDTKNDTFLGIQVQVTLNNVQGKLYPFAYAVVLGKGAFEFRNPSSPFKVQRGTSGEVVFRVVLPSSGYHTPPKMVEGILSAAHRIAGDRKS